MFFPLFGGEPLGMRGTSCTVVITNLSESTGLILGNNIMSTYHEVASLARRRYVRRAWLKALHRGRRPSCEDAQCLSASLLPRHAGYERLPSAR